MPAMVASTRLAFAVILVRMADAVRRVQQEREDRWERRAQEAPTDSWAQPVTRETSVQREIKATPCMDPRDRWASQVLRVTRACLAALKAWKDRWRWTSFKDRKEKLVDAVMQAGKEKQVLSANQAD